jgi:tRNA U34 5-methylaminomethyl-2-thiouridine-forming methyltransferase MnmC
MTRRDPDSEARLTWHAGVPVSARFDDPYFSLEDGLAEARHVFLAGNDLPGRFRPGFRIAELGFGTGLNMLAAWIAWREAGIPGPLRYTGFEAFPLSAAETRTALAALPEAAAVAGRLLDALERGETRIEAEGLSAEIVPGDARHTLPVWQGHADAWFLDGFAPAKNPELWGEALMAEVARHTEAGGSFATFSAAGHVRRALERAGFAVARLPGYGRKRHLSRGTLAA